MLRWLWDWTKSIAVALVVWFFLRTFLVEAAARRLDAGNEMIARNLLNWYRLPEDKDISVSPDTREETRRRAAQLAAALH